MTLRQVIRRAAASALTFVLVTIFTAWGICVVLDVAIYRDESTKEYRLGTLESFENEEQVSTGADNEEPSTSTDSEELSTSTDNNEQVSISGVLAISLLCGLVAGALVWVPTAPKHSSRHHGHSGRRRMRS